MTPAERADAQRVQVDDLLVTEIVRGHVQGMTQEWYAALKRRTNSQESLGQEWTAIVQRGLSGIEEARKAYKDARHKDAPSVEELLRRV